MVGVREYNPKDLKKKSAIEWYNNMLTLRPNDTGLLYARGSALAKMGECEEAIKSFDKVTTLDPEHIKGWEGKAKTLFNVGRHVESLECYDKLTGLDKSNETYWYGKGEALSKLGRFKEAIECYTYAIELNPNYMDAWCAKGNALKEFRSRKKPALKKTTTSDEKNPKEVAESTGALEDALRCFTEVLKRAPLHAKALEGKGVVLLKMGKVNEGLADLNKAIEINPSDPRPLQAKGEILYRMGKKDEARSAFAKIMEAPFSHNISMDPDSWTARGLASLTLDKFEDSVGYFEKALSINPEDPKAWNGKGDALSKLGRYSEAISCYERAIKVKPQDEYSWLGMAKASRFEGRANEALGLYDKAISINPGYAEAWFEKGTLLTVLKRLREAIECFTRVLRIDPKHEGAIAKRQEIEECFRSPGKEMKMITMDSKELPLSKAEQAIKESRYEDALELCDEMLDQNRDDSDIWDMKARVLTKMGRYSESVECHKMVVKLRHGEKPKAHEKTLIEAKIIDPQSTRPELPVPNGNRRLGNKADEERREKCKMAFKRIAYATRQKVIERNKARLENIRTGEKSSGKDPRTAGCSHQSKPIDSFEDMEKITMKYQPKDLDDTDKRIIGAIMNGGKPVPEICSNYKIPIAVGYSRVLRLQALGLIVCVGRIHSKEGSRELKVYRCTKDASVIMNLLGSEIEKESSALAINA